jgi:hypothetical protein
LRKSLMVMNNTLEKVWRRMILSRCSNQSILTRVDLLTTQNSLLQLWTKRIY